MRATTTALFAAGILAIGACAEDAPAPPPRTPDSELVTDTSGRAGTVDTTAAARPQVAADTTPGSAVPLDPNRTPARLLANLPGMTPALADSLAARRPFPNMLAVDSLLARTMGEAQREALYRRLWLPLDLNAASAAEIELIPGVGPRMRHEFEEYRPYRDIEQFRREIGKYTDRAEVARLEQYVTIR